MERFLLTFDEFRYLQKHKLNLEKRFNIKIILPEVFNSNTYASVHGVKEQIGALKDLMKQKTFGFTMMPLSVSVPLISLSDSESDTPADPSASDKEVEECTNPVKFSVTVGEENSNVAQASSNNVSVEVPLEFGHRANEKAVHSSDGGIYDWTLFVRGENGCEIGHFVEKVIFRFRTMKKVIREPPYMVAGTDTAGFSVSIKVFFKWIEDPRVVRFKYNVRLGKNRPPSDLRVEKLTFLNPREEFLSMLRNADEVSEPLRKRMRIEEAAVLPLLSITSNVEGDRTVLLHDTPQENFIHLKSDSTASTSQAADDSIYVIDNQGLNGWTLNNFNNTSNKTKEQKSALNQHLPYRNSFFPPSLFSTLATASTSLVAYNSCVVAAEKGMQSGCSVNGHNNNLSIIEDNSLQSRPLASETNFIQVSSDDESAASSTSQVANDSVVVIEDIEEDNNRSLNNLSMNEVKNRNGLMGVNNYVPPNSDNEVTEASASQEADDSIVVIDHISPKQTPRVMMGVDNYVPPNSDNEISEASTSQAADDSIVVIDGLMGVNNYVPPNSENEVPEASQAANDSIVMIGHISPQLTPRALLRNKSKIRKKLMRGQRLPPSMDFIPLSQAGKTNRIKSKKRKYNATTTTAMSETMAVMGDSVPPSDNKNAVVEVPRPKCRRLLRPVVIDGSNVAREHGLVNSTFSCKGIQISVDYFLERGHTRVTVFIPKYRKHQTYGLIPTTSAEILDDLARAGRLAYTPSRKVAGKRQVCYDDRFIVELAADTGGVILSNDNYRDIMDESPAFKKTIEERLLMFCFVGDKIMIPKDPTGRDGPSLDDFLSFP